ncbi:MAG TPA: GAF domain-containing SpoIIE family protein phosphatase [Solirubrobacteraceae bacterium]|nr:GAF domain-containing SpoIIE family protein phosphatase [Solirubrobacteraceae bacterium]
MTKLETTFTGEPARRYARHAHAVTSRSEAYVAVASAAALYVIGATLIATAFLLPHVSSPAGCIAVAATAYLTAAALMLAFARRRVSLTLAWVADIWGIVLVSFLCAASGGASSPFALLYFFALGHAAAFQPRGRFLIVSLAALLAFLAPLAYSDVSTSFGAFVCVGAVLALLTTSAVHYALGRMREQRWRLEFLIAATAKLDSSLDPQQTLHKIARTAVPDLAELCVIDLIDADGSITDTVAAAVDPAVAAELERTRRVQPLEIATARSEAVATALRTRTPHVVEDQGKSPTAPVDERDHDHHDAVYRSAAFPMVARGRMLGTISFFHPSSYERSQLAILEDLTGRAALAFDNARLYAERDHVAHTLRRSLMPAALPVIPGLDLASYFRPMGPGSEVGGDFYDVFGNGTSCWLVVGDVCGKGAEAAALTGFLRHTSIAYARDGISPARVLSRVNQAMLEQNFDGRFATAILAHLGFANGEAKVTVAAAGHPPALIARAGGRAEVLGESGTLLGVFSDPVIREVMTTLRAGDALTLYTDGLTEAHAPDRMITVAAMTDQLAHSSHGLARDAIDALLELIDPDTGARDDIAILTARVKAAPDS